jgi:hypothetical protein
MTDLRIFVELDGLPLILAQVLHPDGSTTDNYFNFDDEARDWLQSALGPEDSVAIHTRPFQRI